MKIATDKTKLLKYKLRLVWKESVIHWNKIKKNSILRYKTKQSIWIGYHKINFDTGK